MNEPDLTTPLASARPKSNSVSNAAAEAEQQRAIAETQAAMIIAKRFPRDEKEALDRVLNACTRQGLAEVALYSYSRGGSDITGPSIRLAEALAQNWGNLQFGIRELSQHNGESTVEAFAWDLETNTRQVKVFQVPHIRYSKSKGNTKLEDPRDIYELIANQGARRLRACILGVIPGDVIEIAVKQCDTTLTTKADTSPAAVKKMVDAFAEWGVTSEMIEVRIQRRLDSINPAQIVQLRKVFNSLKEGLSKPEDWFEMTLAKKDVVSPSNAESSTKPQTQTTAKPEGAAKKEPAKQAKKEPATKVDAETGEITEQAGEQSSTGSEDVPAVLRNVPGAQAAASPKAKLSFGD